MRRPVRAALQLLLPVALVALGTTTLTLERAAQDDPPAGDDEPGVNPLTGFREGERARLEREIVGSWILTSYEATDVLFDENDYRGFAQLHGGFLTFVFYGSEDVVGFLVGPTTQYTVQAEVFRYRIDPHGRLQTASMMGFHNFNEDGEFEFPGTQRASEYDVLLEGDDLQLSHPDGRRFGFRRLTRTDFPEWALEALRGDRGGLPFDEE